MNTFNQLRAAAALVASSAAVLMMYCEPAAAQVGPEEAAAVAPAVASYQETGLSNSMIEAAGAYSLYMRKAGDIGARFTDGGSVAKSVRTGAAYDAKQMARGVVAFAAVVALQDEVFTRGVQQAGRDPEMRRQLVANLLANPNYAAGIHGADRTAAVVASALGADGSRVRSAGHGVKLAAYSVQREDWSKAEVSGRVQRLAEAKALSATPLKADAHDLAMGLQAVSDAGPVRVSFGEPRVSPVVARGLAVAALAVLGEAAGENAAAVDQLLTDPECAMCLRMSKLNLFQCLAVAKPWYEDVFCLGQHVLIDTGECVYNASGRPKSALVAMALPGGRRED